MRVVLPLTLSASLAAALLPLQVGAATPTTVSSPKPVAAQASVAASNPAADTSVAPSTSAADTPIIDADVVTVSGQFAGPGLWKVSKGDHALWIFGTVSPVPRGLEWYSRQAETVLARTQEIIQSPGVSASVGLGGMFKMAFAMPTMLRSRNLPDDKTLRDVLPTDLYARWSTLRQQYRFNDDDVERMRPVFAASYLYAAALKRAGLDGESGIGERVGELVKQHKIKVTQTRVSKKIDDPKGLAKSFAREQIDDVPCFRSMLSLLESDVAVAAQRANAWASGDVPTLLRLAKRPNVSNCTDVAMATEAGRKLGMDAAIKQSTNNWMAAVERGLANNHTTFAVLPVGELVNDDGLLAQLRAKGYVVEPPRSSAPEEPTADVSTVTGTR